MTNKQLVVARRELRSEASGLQITLEYSIKLLEDYRSDLKSELAELNKTLRKSKLKFKNITAKLDEHDKIQHERLSKS